MLALYVRVAPVAAQNAADDAQDRAAQEAADRAMNRAQDQQRAAEPNGSATSADDAPTLNPLQLLVDGGPLMIPIGALSVVVVLVAIERALALRRSRVMPEGLVAALGQLGARQAPFEPQAVYRICQQFPSAASNVIRAMLLKVGRPHSEVEHAVAQASDREATVLYGNVRWLTMSAAVGPLLGLLGTVQGMIMAFFVTATADPGQNKATMLATGIYIALVTTFAGLCVAIPAVVIAHFFEGRIQALFREIDDLVSTLLPHVERFEGRLRTSAKSLDGADKPIEATVVEKARG
ncbi:MAG: MotA/TolQ/ExbB proton channel family protein [Planctomycetota bacterium]|nr:MAG: MotA/TolQ/ExbB proton channel family protein [Planctomycetota bacterium]